MKDLLALLRLLGDDARLRILRLLTRERLNVTELTAILGLAQSGVSRHLGLLRDGGLVEEARDGGYTWYRAVPGADSSGVDLWSWLTARMGSDDRQARADDARLAEVLRHRRERFTTHGGEGRQLVPGRSWSAWSRALGLLLPALDVGDLGCGEGYLTIEAARWARHVVAVDRSSDVLRAARALAARRKAANITWMRGELEALPLEDATLDLALLSQALHHAVEPAVAVAEAVRVTRPSGRVLVLDLRRHEQVWVRDLGDRRLGFGDDELGRLLEGAGLDGVRVDVGARQKGDPFTVLVARGTKPAADARPDGFGGAERSAAGPKASRLPRGPATPGRRPLVKASTRARST